MKLRDASRQGAPQAKQIADRFHLVQNLRAAIKRQLSRLERPIRGYRANPGCLLVTDGVPPDGKICEDEPRDLTHVSSDRRSDLADRRSGAVHQIMWHAHTAAGREGRCSQAGSADICLHAIRDAMGCGVHAMQSFAAKLRHDIDAVRNAIREPWSNGQTEGQINRLKMLQRAMYGRASVVLLCARMRRLRELEYHQM